MYESYADKIRHLRPNPSNMMGRYGGKREGRITTRRSCFAIDIPIFNNLIEE